MPNSQEKRSQQTQSLIDQYMVHRNQVGDKLALATVTASLMGGWILFNPPEAGSTFGGITAILGYCFGTAAAALAFAVVGPRLRKIMPWGYSLNEYVRYRFQSQGGRGLFAKPLYWLVVAVMLLYMFVYMTAELTAVVQALKQLTSLPSLETALSIMLVIFLYTAIGGLRATILTDAIQFVLIVPLLVLCFWAMVSNLGGLSASLEPVKINFPELLSLGNIDGLRFGASLLIAITAAELFNQANWQRVYACRNEQTVRRSFVGSAFLIFPLIFLVGSLGLMAAGQNFQGETAFFKLFVSLSMPTWSLFVVLILASALVMSSIDSLLNAITSVLTWDMMRLSGQVGDRAESQALIIARSITMATGFLAIAIALDGDSLIYLFFVADLLCSALIFPVIFSFYNRHQTAHNALWSALAGIAMGILFFPRPDFSPLFDIPGAGDLLNSFTVALLTPSVLTLLWSTIVRKTKQSTVLPFSYSELRDMALHPKNH